MARFDAPSAVRALPFGIYRKIFVFEMLGNALCLLHLDLFRDDSERITSFDDKIRMWKKLRLSFVI
jgi:hypothetical protein